METLLGLLCNMDVFLLSVGIALSFIIVGHLCSVVHARLVHKSDQLEHAEIFRLEKILTDPKLVQNFCFIQNDIALKMFRKEAPDDKEDHFNSLFA